MRLKQTLAVVFVALFLMGQTSPKTVTVIYAPSDPTTATCKSGQTWQNTTAGTLFGCNVAVNPTAWQSLGSSGAAGFPITATSGATTVTLTGDPVAQTGAYSLSNATQGAGWNTALAGALGFSDFAFNSIFTAINSATLNDANATQDVSLTNGGFLARLRVLINGESQDHPHVILTTEGFGSTTGSLEVQSPPTGSTIGINVSDGGTSTVQLLEESSPAKLSNIVTNGTRTLTQYFSPGGAPGRHYSLLFSAPAGVSIEEYISTGNTYNVLVQNAASSIGGISTFAGGVSLSANSPNTSAAVDLSPGLVSTSVDDAGGISVSQSFAPTGWAFPYRGSGVTVSGGAINPRSNVYKVTTGGAALTDITAATAGACHVLIFNDGGDVSEGGNINLSASPFTVTANDTLTLCTDGTTWFETARSVN